MMISSGQDTVKTIMRIMRLSRKMTSRISLGMARSLLLSAKSHMESEITGGAPESDVTTSDLSI